MTSEEKIDVFIRKWLHKRYGPSFLIDPMHLNILIGAVNGALKRYDQEKKQPKETVFKGIVIDAVRHFRQPND
jgi:hypothetical protein